MQRPGFHRLQYAQKEALAVFAFSALQCLTLAHFVHEGWYANLQMMKLHPPQPGSSSSTYYIFQNPTLPLHAPEAYRIALPALGRFLGHALHVADASKVAAALDFIFALCALMLFYRLAVEPSRPTTQTVRQRVLKVALFFAFIQSPIHWIVPWQRPETLPTALFLAFALLCLSRAAAHPAWSAALIAATILQSFVRADVPCMLAAALCILSLFGSSLASFGSRPNNFLRGAAIGLVAVGVQAYLQLVRFPHLTYWPDTPVVTLAYNFELHNLADALLALSPFIVIVSLLFLLKIKPDAVSSVTLVAAGLFLPVWFIVGIVDEVRVYVPFLFALSLVAAKSLAALVESLAEPAAVRGAGESSTLSA